MSASLSLFPAIVRAPRPECSFPSRRTGSGEDFRFVGISRPSHLDVELDLRATGRLAREAGSERPAARIDRDEFVPCIAEDGDRVGVEPSRAPHDSESTGARITIDPAKSIWT